jgi:hypothetical protein
MDIQTLYQKTIKFAILKHLEKRANNTWYENALCCAFK